MKEKRYLEETRLLDYWAENIQALIQQKGWNKLDEYEKIQQIYNYVRDDILFGYNVGDYIPAHQVLIDHIGQCNTKTTLLMALLRAVGIPCRVHAFTVFNKVQKGATSGIVSRHIPDEVMHTWTEVYYQEQWYDLEGVIIDRAYLNGIYRKFHNPTGYFCGYGVCIPEVENPVIDWDANNTYIQKSAINQDFGVYDSPDALSKEHGQELSKVKELLFMHYGRHVMNRNVNRIRNCKC